jgi:hypothetical protein
VRRNLPSIPRPYLIAAAALGGLTPLLISPLTAGATTAPGVVTGAAATVNGDVATVSWTAPAGGAPGGYQVGAYLGHSYYGTRVAPPGATSLTWDGLPFNSTMTFTVAAIGPDLPGGDQGSASSASATNAIKPVNNYCPASITGDCVIVNTAAAEGTETRPAAGLLHGTVPAGNQYAQELNLTHWRIQSNNPTQYAQASSYVPSNAIIEVLSDGWVAATKQENLLGQWQAADPWANWTAYTNFVKSTVSAAEQAGQNPYWEIQNEPENYPYSTAQPPTRALVEQEYLYAYQAIKAVDPNARVIGPSIDWQYSNQASPWYIDMKSFIPFAAANNMQLAAIAWHDNFDVTDTNPVSYWETPQDLLQQSAEVRTLIAENPAIGNPQLFVDENSSAAGQFSPGWEAGYMAADDGAGVALAGRSCWAYPENPAASYCFGPYLDELLNLDGQPNASFWVMADYGAMNGTRDWSESTDANLSTLAVTDPSGETRLMIGRHQTCSGWTAGLGACPAVVPPLTVPATINVLVPGGATSANVTVQEVQDTRSDMGAAPATVTSTVAVNGGDAIVSLPKFADGEAYFVTVTPNSLSGPATPDGNQSSSTSTVSSSTNPSVFGQPVTLTSTVGSVYPGQGTPTGSVSFYSGSINLGSSPLVNGVARLTTTSLPSGNSVVTSLYSGDSTFQVSAGWLQTLQAVNTAATSTVISTAPASGSTATLSARVSPTAPSVATPTGTVTFFLAGGTQLGTATVTNGVATLTAVLPGPGSYQIAAVYWGATGFAGSSQWLPQPLVI